MACLPPRRPTSPTSPTISRRTDRRRPDSDDGHGASAQDRTRPCIRCSADSAPAQPESGICPGMLDDHQADQYTVIRRIRFDKDRYAAIVNKLKAILVDLERSDLPRQPLNVLEATLSFVPSSTTRVEVVDVSLFDHLKLTGALGACIWHYLQPRTKRLQVSAVRQAEHLLQQKKPSCSQLSTSQASGLHLHDPFLGCREDTTCPQLLPADRASHRRASCAGGSQPRESLLRRRARTAAQHGVRAEIRRTVRA